MITSTSNQQIKSIIKLQKSRKARKEQQVFLVEGIRMFREIPAERLVKAYMTEEWMEKLAKERMDNTSNCPKDVLAELEEGKNFEVVSEGVFRDMSDTQTPQGILAVVRQMTYERETLLTGTVEGQTKSDSCGNVPAPCILVLENIQDPGNLGTIFRTAEGAGVTGIMMSPDTVDVYNSKVVRSTMGAIFRMPFLYEEDISQGVAWLKEHGICCYAAHLNGRVFYDYDYRKPSCFFLGNEGNGLTPELTALADEPIRIPMCGQVESLNVATAATVLIYEAMRQRLQ